MVDTWKFVHNPLAVCGKDGGVSEGAVRGVMDGVSETAGHDDMHLNAKVPPCWCWPIDSPRAQLG